MRHLFSIVESITLLAIIFLPLINAEPERIIVIGSGAAGSSFVHFLSKESLDSKENLDFQVYEKSEIIGGRAKVLNITTSVCEKGECLLKSFDIELGASIFASSNQHLMNFSRDFGLEFETDDKDFNLKNQPKLGIYDGNEFRITLDGWLDSAKMILRYGLAPLSASRICNGLVAQFVEIYKHLVQGKSWKEHSVEMSRLSVQDTVSSYCTSYYKAKGISQRYIDEFLGSIVRNIYLTNVQDLNAFACTVALFATVDNTHRIKGGNKEIYKNLLKPATVHLSTKVTQIERLASGLYKVLTAKDAIFAKFVVIASPILNSGIKLVGIEKKMPEFEYVKLYVTVVFGKVNPAHFGLKTIDQVPLNILTPADSTTFYNCISTHPVNATHSISKLFSPRRLTDEQIGFVFESAVEIYRQDWDQPGAYPLLMPLSRTTTLPVEIDKNLFYVNSMERWISTMETETIAGRNVALLVSERLKASHKVVKKKPKATCKSAFWIPNFDKIF